MLNLFTKLNRNEKKKLARKCVNILKLNRKNSLLEKKLKLKQCSLTLNYLKKLNKSN